MSSRRLRALAFGLGAVALAALAGSGCGIGGGKSSDASTATTVHDHASHDHGEGENKPDVDPCALVTRAEAEQVLGPIAVTSEEGALGVVGEQRVCRLTVKKDDRFGVNIGLADHDADRKFAGLHGRLRSLATDVPELGDKAVWIKQFRLLMVLQDSELLSVQMTNLSDDITVAREQAVKLASRALSRLPAARDY